MLRNSTSSNSSSNITEITSTSIFSAPPHSILLHACNAKGSWGAGVASAFKAHYPTAYSIYRTHCLQPSRIKTNCALRSHQQSLVGTTLLISPQDEDGSTEHWIACLFTSHGFGRSVAQPEEILDATGWALVDLKRQIVVGDHDNDNHKNSDGDGEEKMKERKAVMTKGMGDCWAVKLNSGKFGVPWVKTRQVLDQAGLKITVVSTGDAAAAATTTTTTEKTAQEREKTNPDTKKLREGATGQRRKRARTDGTVKDGDGDQIEGKDRAGATKRARRKKGDGSGREGGRIDQWLRQR